MSVARSFRLLLVVASVALMLCPLAGGAVAAEPDSEGFTPIFDGKTLAGWEGDKLLWRAENGSLVGETTGTGIRYNDFLATEKSYGNFELRLEFKMHEGKGNSGVQIRSKRDTAGKDTKAVSGYQADIGDGYWGTLYDEHRRNKGLSKLLPEADKVVKKDDWNTYVIRADGPQITLTLNGLKTTDYREDDDKIAREGIIAFQLHSGGPTKIEFRNIRIKELKLNP